VTERATILLVDDRVENLVALEAILEPLGQNLIRAHSGEEALRQLLVHDVAVILLDVQMPGLDGFETAALIKQRERTRGVPIIFVTAISKDEQHVFRGYSTGAVDYIFKPLNPDILRSKVAAFVEIYQRGHDLQRQAELLRERELVAARRESEQRYRALADAMPQIVWTAGPDGKATYYNRRWFDYTGLEPGPVEGNEWMQFIHPDDLKRTLDHQRESLASGDVFEIEYRIRGLDGAYRWHLGRAVPRRRATGEIDFWVGTATDIDAHKRNEQAQDFLLRADAVLAVSLDYRRTLQAVAQLAVPEIADWCAIDLVEPDGTIRSLAVVHSDPAKTAFARELRERYPPNQESGAVVEAIRTRESQLVADIPEEALRVAAVDELHLDLLHELGLRSYMCVPLVIRDETVGAITLVGAESARRFTDADLRMGQELARRAAIAIDNARLYRQAEERAQAARVLEAIGDGVMLLDTDGVIRLWNAAAAAITGIRREQIVGRRASEAWPSFAEAAPRVPIESSGTPAVARTLPIEAGARELWMSISGVDFEDGFVYAFRDLTNERALEEMRQDLVATVSHELRTPLAAIYGSALTLQRDDLQLEGGLGEKLLEVIAEESTRLTAIVDDLLLVSQLDAGKLEVQIEQCDASELVQSVIESARTHLPDGIDVRLERPPSLQPVAADSGQLRQVVENLVDNAIKYSPDGGEIRVQLEPAERHLRFAVVDHGLGIPSSERGRIFEKFYRLDPDMTGGIGGTGLGLYICRELVRRVDGRIWVEPNDGGGSVFYVEIPFAESRVRSAA
jgi:PAS domain S-box-containing protein